MKGDTVRGGCVGFACKIHDVCVNAEIFDELGDSGGNALSWRKKEFGKAFFFPKVFNKAVKRLLFGGGNGKMRIIVADYAFHPDFCIRIVLIAVIRSNQKNVLLIGQFVRGKIFVERRFHEGGVVKNNCGIECVAQIVVDENNGQFLV